MPGLRSQTTDGVKGAFLISTLGPPGEAGPKPDLARGSPLENRIHPERAVHSQRTDQAPASAVWQLDLGGRGARELFYLASLITSRRDLLRGMPPSLQPQVDEKPTGPDTAPDTNRSAQALTSRVTGR